MAETLTLELRLTADGSGIVGEVRGATDALQRLRTGEDRAGDAAKRLATDTDHYAASQRKATQSTGALSSATSSFARTLITTATAYLSLRTAADLVDTYRRQEQAVASLDAALTSMGRTSVGLSGNLQALASQIQGEGIIGDEDIIKGQAFLATYAQITDDVLPRATRVMVDIAAKMGGDMTGAANLVGKAAMGMTGELSRTGITLSETAKESKDFTLILSEIEAQVGGTNAALGATATGGITQFSNALGDAREVLGKIIAEATSPWLRELSRDVAASSLDVDRWRDSFDGAFELILRGAGVVRDAFYGFELAFKAGHLAWEGFKLAILTGLDALASPARFVLEQLDRLPDFATQYVPQLRLLKEAAQGLANLDGGGIKAWAQDTRAEVDRLTDELVQMASITEAPSAAWTRRLDEIRARIDAMRAPSDRASVATGGFARALDSAGDSAKALAKEVQVAARILDELFPEEAAFREHIERLDVLERAYARGQIATEKYAAALAAEEERYLRLSMATDGAAEKADKYARETFEASSGSRRAADAARELGMSFSSAFEDAVVKGKGVREVLAGIAEDIARIVTRKAITEPFADALSGFAGDLLGGMFGGAGGEVGFSDVGPFADVADASVLHAGGEVGRDGHTRRVPARVFRAAPRMHSGGLAGDEVPAILQRGERVLPRGAGAGPAITVNYAPVIQAIDTRTGADFLAGQRNVIVGLVNEAFNRRGQRGPVR